MFFKYTLFVICLFILHSDAMERQKTIVDAAHSLTLMYAIMKEELKKYCEACKRSVTDLPDHNYRVHGAGSIIEECAICKITYQHYRKKKHMDKYHYEFLCGIDGCTEKISKYTQEYHQAVVHKIPYPEIKKVKMPREEQSGIDFIASQMVKCTYKECNAMITEDNYRYHLKRHFFKEKLAQNPNTPVRGKRGFIPIKKRKTE